MQESNQAHHVWVLLSLLQTCAALDHLVIKTAPFLIIAQPMILPPNLSTTHI